MIIKKLISTVCIGCFVALTACSNNRALPPAEPVDEALPLASITLLPVDSPEALYTDNRGIPVVAFIWTGIANIIMDKYKSAEFDTQHQRYRQQIGDKFTRALQRELQALGFKVRLANRSEVSRNQKNELNMRTFAGHDAVLDVQITDFAMSSRRLRLDYQPMIAGYLNLMNPADNDYLMSSWYSYGTHATKTANGYILSDPKFSFSSFNSLISQPELVEESFDDGIQLIATHFAADLRKQYKPIIQVARTEDSATRPAPRINPTTSSKATRKKGKGTPEPIRLNNSGK